MRHQYDGKPYYCVCGEIHPLVLSENYPNANDMPEEPCKSTDCKFETESMAISRMQKKRGITSDSKVLSLSARFTHDERKKRDGD